jgi:hypothetical protein
LSGDVPYQLGTSAVKDLTSYPAGKGTVVYNTGGTLAAGIYVWDGSKWLEAGTTGTVTPSAKPLTAFTLSTIGLTFTAGGANQDVSVVTWTPSDADTKEVTWGITGTGSATITNQTANLVTVKAGTAAGDNTLTATAKPGSGTATPQTVTIRTNAADAVGGTELSNGVYTERTGYVTAAPFTGWVATGATLKVANANTGGQVLWQAAKDACAALGGGWRLPNAAELKFMYNNKATLEAASGFTAFSHSYWSSTEYSDMAAWNVYFTDGTTNLSLAKTLSHLHVRCVRSL